MSPKLPPRPPSAKLLFLPASRAAKLSRLGSRDPSGRGPQLPDDEGGGGAEGGNHGSTRRPLCPFIARTACAAEALSAKVTLPRLPSASMISTLVTGQPTQPSHSRRSPSTLESEPRKPDTTMWFDLGGAKSVRGAAAAPPTPRWLSSGRWLKPRDELALPPLVACVAAITSGPGRGGGSTSAGPPLVLLAPRATEGCEEEEEWRTAAAARACRLLGVAPSLAQSMR